VLFDARGEEFSMSRSRTLIASLIAFAGCLAATHVAWAEPLTLHLRHRTETAPGSGRYHAVVSESQWEPAETALVVCDMWDQHWCRGATARVAEMAPRMNDVLEAARAAGVLIIHCPSACMDFYEGTPQREMAKSAPTVETEIPLEGWCHLDPDREGELPIDDSDGGCDCEPKCTEGSPWTRQIATLEIGSNDAITDSEEAYYLMRSRGVKNVLVMGVHVNMCVLGRTFAIRQMVRQGMNVALVRDMTDAMYNSRSRPFVDHFSGNDLVVEHIERHWCPTVTSDDFTGRGEFRFAADTRRHVAIVSAEDEYDTARTLTEFADERLRHDYRVSLIYGSETDRHDIPGIDAVADADCLLVSVRRRPLPPAQLDVLRQHVAAGKGVVGIRTASHAFAPPRGEGPPDGLAIWPEFDRDVLGGNYTNHHGNGEDGPGTVVSTIPDARAEEVLAGVPADGFTSHGSLYKVSPLASGALPLMIGRVEGQDAPEPVAWINRPQGSRVFYTSLGHRDDFEEAAFTTLLTNAIRWAAAPQTDAPADDAP
jgi:nicotinamidase-related amidase/type 1 glutamine amidotransferase